MRCQACHLRQERRSIRRSNLDRKLAAAWNSRGQRRPYTR
jgi:hypothetical protein